MKKRKTACPERLPKEKANFDTVIVSDFDNEAQDIFWRNSSTPALKRFVEDGKLTDCLNLLESRGFSGESALFILGCIQPSGGAR